MSFTTLRDILDASEASRYSNHEQTIEEIMRQGN